MFYLSSNKFVYIKSNFIFVIKQVILAVFKIEFFFSFKNEKINFIHKRC